MGDLTFGDYGAILLGLLVTGAVLFSGFALAALWPQPWRGIAQGVTALFQRYTVSSVSVGPRYDWKADDKESYVNEPVYQPGIKAPDTSINIGIAPFDANAVPSNLTYEEQVAILARLVTPAGKQRYSGKKIYDLVGGNYNEFCALMRRLRVKDGEPAEEPDILTPIAGRPTKASYFSDPDLVYEPPEH